MKDYIPIIGGRYDGAATESRDEFLELASSPGIVAVYRLTMRVPSNRLCYMLDYTTRRPVPQHAAEMIGAALDRAASRKGKQ